MNNTQLADLVRTGERRLRQRTDSTVAADFETLRTMMGLLQVTGDALSQALVAHIAQPNAETTLAVLAARGVWERLRTPIKEETCK